MRRGTNAEVQLLSAECWVLSCISAEVQRRCRGAGAEGRGEGADVKRSEVQRCRGAECRGAEVQRCIGGSEEVQRRHRGGAEVQCCSCRGEGPEVQM